MPSFFLVLFVNSIAFKYSASVEKGIVEYVSFRGKEVEAGIRIKDTLIKGNRKIEDEEVYPDEEVRIYIYRVYVLDDRGEVEIVENENIRSQSDIVI